MDPKIRTAINEDEPFAKTRSLEQRFKQHIQDHPQEALMQLALETMFGAHFEDWRPDGQPYINHPLEVTLSLIEDFQIDQSSMIMAGLLHDTVEDVPEKLCKLLGSNETSTDCFYLITQTFGARTSELVGYLTSPDFKALVQQQYGSLPEDIFIQRKNEIYREHVLSIFEEDQEAALIKFSDLSQNALSLAQLEDGPRKTKLKAKYRPLIQALITKMPQLPFADTAKQIMLTKLKNAQV